jgi:hypothetical protein
MREGERERGDMYAAKEEERGGKGLDVDTINGCCGLLCDVEVVSTENRTER